MPVHIEDAVLGSLLHALMRIARALCLCITARSGVLDVHVHVGIALSLEPNLLCTYTILAQACKSVHLACFTLISWLICDDQQLYTDAAIHRRSARTAPVLSASRRVAKTARSGVLGVHGHCVVSNHREPVLCTYTNLAQACKSVRIARALRLCTCIAAECVCV